MDMGLRIVVLDKGFVYVGNVSLSKDNMFLDIKNAHNIRRYGTNDGLGELALKGPLRNTILDKCGDISAPLTSVVHLMSVNESKWKTN